jgi:Do/DeqQ family serine protease
MAAGVNRIITSFRNPMQRTHPPPAAELSGGLIVESIPFAPSTGPARCRGRPAVVVLAAALAGATLFPLVSCGGERSATGAAGAAREAAPGNSPEPGDDAPAGGSRPAAAAVLPAAARTAGPSDGYAEVIRGVLPSVVNIFSVQVITTYEYSPFLADPFFRYFFGDQFGEFVVPRERRGMSLGSGVVVHDGGTILTNNHVVEHAREVRVLAADGREHQARLVGADARTDLAVLRIENTTLPAARLGDSETLQVGDIVLAIGNPFGLGGTVTMGIVSAIGRGSLGIADYEDFIQTDAAINPGNSGGALINSRGEVVGINTAIYSRTGGYQGIGFAIPSSMVRGVLDSILETGRVVRGYAGLYIQRLTTDMARAFGLDEARGALVAAVDPDGPAARAGLRRGDVIVSFGDRPVASEAEFRTQMSRLKPGDTARLGVARNGRRLEVEVVLAEPPQRPARQPRRRG